MAVPVQAHALLSRESGRPVGNVRQRRIAIVFATLAPCALFLAQGTTALLAGTFLPLDATVVEQARTRRPRGAGAGDVGTRADATNILRRNIFDSRTGDLLAVATEEEPAEEEEVAIDPDAPPPPCEGAIRLVGSLVNTRYPEWSFAAITGPAGKALLYRAGMSIEGRQLLAIGPRMVFLRPSDGRVCSLAMFDPNANPSGGPQPTTSRGAVVRLAGERPAEEEDEGAIRTSELEQGINRVSDTEFTVARSLVDKLLENQAELMRTARIIPHQENGRTVGVKLYGIRRNSLLGRLGLQNGDMLRTINGYDMTSPDSALEAYSRLRGANHLTVSIVRRGQAMNIDYSIQ